MHGIGTLLTGMKITGREFFTKKVTEQYPENRNTLEISPRFRGRLTMPIDENGNFHNFVGSKADEILAFVKEGHQIVNAFTFGPSLVKNGEILPLPDTYLTRFNSTTRNPRMVIAQMGPLEYVFVEAQGRNDVSRGVTMEQMAQFMYDLGAMEAYNLDGGNSCVMTFNGRYYDSNYTDSEREQSDIIYVVSAVPEETWQ